MKTQNKVIIIPDYMIVIKWLENEGKCMSDLHRELNITYKHLHEIKHTFLKMEWITMNKIGRRHDLYLTQKGKRMLTIINTLLKEMNINNQQIIELIKKSQIKKKEKINKEDFLKEINNR